MRGRILVLRGRLGRGIVAAAGGGGRGFGFGRGSAHVRDLHARGRLREADAVGDEACAEQQAEQEGQDSHGRTVARASPAWPKTALNHVVAMAMGPPGFEPGTKGL